MKEDSGGSSGAFMAEADACDDYDDEFGGAAAAEGGWESVVEPAAPSPEEYALASARIVVFFSPFSSVGNRQ